MIAGDLCFEDLAVGQRFQSGGRTLTDADIRMYLGATGTNHPNHTDEEYCKRHPILEGVCAPGVLILGFVDAFIADTITSRLGSSMNYGHDKVRYLRPVYVGDTVHAQIEVVDCRTRDDDWGVIAVNATAVNQHGSEVLFDSHLLVVQRRSAAVREQ